MVEVRKVLQENDADVRRIAELEAEIFVDAWSKKSIKETMKQGHSYCAVVEEDGEILGYFICYFVLDEWEIARIAVAPAARRLGIGRALLGHLFQVSKEQGAYRILLDVRSSNAPAICFYQQAGFIADGRRKDFYTLPQREDAILMSKIL